MNKARFAAAGAFLIWGIGIAITKYTLLTMPFFVMGAMRYSIATPTVGVKALSSLIYIKGRTAKLLYLRTVLNIVQMATLFLALLLVDATFVSMFGLLLPLLVYNLAVRFLHERHDRHLLIGSFVAIIGSVVATFATSGISGGVNIIGLGLVLINLFADGISTIITKSLRSELSGEQLNGMFFASNVVFYLIFTAVMWGTFPFSDIDSVAWLGLIWLVLMNSILALRLYMYSIKRIKATELSLYVYIAPIAGMISSIVLLGERHNALFWAGVGTVIIGILYAERWMKFRLPEFFIHRIHNQR